MVAFRVAEFIIGGVLAGLVVADAAVLDTERAPTSTDTSAQCPSLLQTSATRQRNMPLQDDPEADAAKECKLPAGAVWCEVRPHNQQPFWMAVYDWNVAKDWVSYNICQSGFWEESDFSQFGTPGHMLDIGANVGYYTLSLAKAGWTVTSFEPMSPNLELIQASLCRNPEIAGKVRINPFGLGVKNQQCKMFSPNHNVGDGFTRCDDAGAEVPRQPDEDTFVEKGTFTVKRLDEVLASEHIQKVDMVKIDVEGYEYQVFSSAPNFLAQYKPRLIKSEVWINMVGTQGAPVSGLEYLGLFENAGYRFFMDNTCRNETDAKAQLRARGVTDARICLGS